LQEKDEILNEIGDNVRCLTVSDTNTTNVVTFN